MEWVAAIFGLKKRVCGYEKRRNEMQPEMWRKLLASRDTIENKVYNWVRHKCWNKKERTKIKCLRWIGISEAAIHTYNAVTGKFVQTSKRSENCLTGKFSKVPQPIFFVSSFLFCLIGWWVPNRWEEAEKEEEEKISHRINLLFN